MNPYLSAQDDYYYSNYPAGAPYPYGTPDVYINQLQPVLSNNPPTTTLTLFKELTGFPNYGNPSGNADILYTGTQGTWTFEVPAFLFIPGLLRAQLLISAVLDDRDVTPPGQYSATIRVNGRIVHQGPLGLVHGRPFGQRFNNWRTLTFDVPVIRRVNQIEIRNTSRATEQDWIGLDWMELRFLTLR